MDNSEAERRFRDPVIGRRLSFGSDSEGGAAFTAIMYSLIGTLAMNGIDVRRWLHEWLEACARNRGKAPDDLDPWLPWSMSRSAGGISWNRGDRRLPLLRARLHHRRDGADTRPDHH